MADTEKRKEYKKKWYLANKERINSCEERKEWRRRYQKDNKEKIASYYKDYNESKKDGYYTVYYLKEEHYVGMTSSLSYRLLKHNNGYNRHVKDVEIIGKYQTKKGALRVEAALHSMGYLGGHPQTKQQTLKQLI
tara:strand:- start:15 stop:419 length:405 start_codon:yes stop_codon:yes gene_type:complete